jgi:hypothetical protein
VPNKKQQFGVIDLRSGAHESAVDAYMYRTTEDIRLYTTLPSTFTGVRAHPAPVYQILLSIMNRIEYRSQCFARRMARRHRCFHMAEQNARPRWTDVHAQPPLCEAGRGSPSVQHGLEHGPARLATSFSNSYNRLLHGRGWKLDLHEMLIFSRKQFTIEI